MRTLLIIAFATPACMLAQANATPDAIKMMFGMGKGVLVRSAEKVPENLYSYKPTDDVRTFGQLVGHVANAQYMFCSTVAGEKSPATADIEKTKTAKADLVQALKDAMAYCDKIYNSMNDTNGNEVIKFFGRDSSRLGVLAFNNMHNYEHYGNMVTYMRLNKIVPPSSEPAPNAAPAAKK
jgi:uncharacterized damage-inducible protein DinB